MFPPISFTFLRVSHGVLTVSSGISYAYPSVSSCFLFKVSRLATKLETLQNLIYETLKNCKSKYYENISKKLCSKAITPKYYWSLIKTNVKWQKSSLHPACFHDNKFVADFSKKVDLFNSFFAKQCSIIVNNSVLPTSTNPITDQHLTNIEFMRDDIKRIIRELDPNKAHGHDMISISILKMLVRL